MMKAQFMSLWDGLITNPDCTVIVMGATNRPQDLDRAILRRMPATFHIGLPVSFLWMLNCFWWINCCPFCRITLLNLRDHYDDIDFGNLVEFWSDSFCLKWYRNFHAYLPHKCCVFIRYSYWHFTDSEHLHVFISSAQRIFKLPQPNCCFYFRSHKIIYETVVDIFIKDAQKVRFPRS
jgi:hypothetical protein